LNNYKHVQETEGEKLARKVQQGIPRQLRGMVWQLLSCSKDRELEDRYIALCRLDSPFDKLIERDINRTFPSHEFFSARGGVGQESLRNVIKAYSLYDPDVGYCQGIGFVAGILILNVGFSLFASARL
jgi:hypothetical protein